MFSAAIAAVGAIAASQAPSTFQSQFTQQAWVPEVKLLPLPKLWHGESIAANEKGQITQHIIYSSIEYEGQQYQVQTNALPVQFMMNHYAEWIDEIHKQHESKLRVELEKAIQKSLETSLRNELVNQLMKTYKPEEE